MLKMIWVLVLTSAHLSVTSAIADTLIFTEDNRIFAIWAEPLEGAAGQNAIVIKECKGEPSASILPRDCEPVTIPSEDGKSVVYRAYVSDSDLGANLVKVLQMEPASANPDSFPEALGKLQKQIERYEATVAPDVLAGKKDFQRRKLKFEYLRDVVKPQYEALVTGQKTTTELLGGNYGNGLAEVLFQSFFERRIKVFKKTGTLGVQLAYYPNSKPSYVGFSAFGFTREECNRNFDKQVSQYQISQTKPGMQPKTFFYKENPVESDETKTIVERQYSTATSQLSGLGISGFAEMKGYRSPVNWLPLKWEKKYEFSYGYKLSEENNAEEFTSRKNLTFDISWRPWVVGHAELFFHDDCVEMASRATSLWTTCSVTELE